MKRKDKKRKEKRSRERSGTVGLLLLHCFISQYLPMVQSPSGLEYSSGILQNELVWWEDGMGLWLVCKMNF